jgi:hypothetical protein
MIFQKNQRTVSIELLDNWKLDILVRFVKGNPEVISVWYETVGNTLTEMRTVPTENDSGDLKLLHLAVSQAKAEVVETLHKV